VHNGGEQTVGARRIRWRNEDGTAAVEFAIIMIVLLIIVFGTVQFGIAYSKLNVYTGAAREGARFAATRCAPTPPCDNDKIADRVSNSAADYDIGPGSPAADTTCEDSNIGTEVTVSWSQDIEVNIPFIPGLNPHTYNRTMSGTFRCE
jgi:Flp pilus assembly protein TadG